MKTVVIYHKAVSKLVFMKISFIFKIIVICQTFRLMVYRQNYHLSSKLQSSKYYHVQSNSSFIMETIVTSRDAWIVETISRVQEAIKIKVKTVANSLGWECFSNYDGVPFNFAIKLYTQHYLFLFSFLKHRDFKFFVISIFAVVKERVANSK